MNFLSYIVVEVSLTKTWRERKKDICKEEYIRECLSLSDKVTSHCQWVYKILTFYLEKLLRNQLRKITVLIAWRERKDNKYQGEQTGQKPVIYPTIQLVIVILNTKYEHYILYSCGDIFDKNVERKKKGHIQGRINWRKLALNPTMQQVIVNLHTKY